MNEYEKKYFDSYFSTFQHFNFSTGFIMKRLFAPWRIGYILGKKEKSCVFCRIRDAKNDQEDFVLQRGKFCYTVLNRFPYTNGHLMVVPYAHKRSLEDLTDDESLEMMQQLKHWSFRMKEVMRIDGCNMGSNLGKAAGAGIEDHIHFHLVPRWAGDENFMPVIGKVKVIPESLESVYSKLSGGK